MSNSRTAVWVLPAALVAPGLDALLSILLVVRAGDVLSWHLRLAAVAPPCIRFCLAFALAMLLVAVSHGDAPGRRVREAAVALALLLVAALGSDGQGGVILGLLVAAPFAAMGARRAARPHARALATAGAWFAIPLAMMLVPGGADPLNELGLVAGRPFAHSSEPALDDANHDDYPAMEIEDNGLGYRDRDVEIAPSPGVRRVLLIGDSYIWGAGIPRNDQILGAVLQQALDQRQPGRYQVISAGLPGNGVYGYARAARALAERFSPGLVIVGYLGRGADTDPLDAQRLVDLCGSGPVVDLAAWAGTLQRFHELSARSTRDWDHPPNLDDLTTRFRDLDAALARQGSRLAVLRFWGFGITPDVLPAHVPVFELPPELRYPGAASPLWYGRDAHPRPEMLRRLAPLVATWVEGLAEAPPPR